MRLLIHNLWDKLTRKFRRRRAPARTFAIEGELLLSLQEIALKERRPETEVAKDLMTQALLARQQAEFFLAKWKELSPREQHVVALCCLGYENSEIAEHLSISLNTVKSHIRNAASKLGLQSKSDLRKMLADWDFQAWDTLGRGESPED